MAAAKARLPSGFAGSHEVTGSLAGTQCRGNTTFTTGIMLDACLALDQRPVARTTRAYATRRDVRAAFSSHTAQSPAVSCQGPGCLYCEIKGQLCFVITFINENIITMLTPVSLC